LARVDIRDARKSFGAVEILHGVSVEISDKSFTVLVGPSGCGKSTLLRMIAGLEEVTSGDIVIGGTVVNRMPPKQRDIAMVFQNYALYPHLKVAENMGFSLMLAKVPAGEMRRRVEEAARILDLTKYLDRYPRQLSGGQRQRVAMGRAIVRNPQVFLFDEPLSNLDAKLRVQMRTEIRELHQRLNSTSIYVTHDQIEAMTMADQIVVMKDGHIAQAGAPLELYDKPANVFVAGFIGSPAMNMIAGEVSSENGKPVMRIIEGAALPLPAKCKLSAGQKIVYGVRPEHLTLSEGIAATVVVVEPTGPETIVMSRLGSQSIMAAFRERHNFKPGAEISLAPALENLHLFDAESGRRIE
jgi:multiple sugar transport system ATP-binding protein